MKMEDIYEETKPGWKIELKLRRNERETDEGWEKTMKEVVRTK